MNLVKTTFIILLLAGTVSCKKDKIVNWTEELRGTVWAGEFQYTSGGNTLEAQPFSIYFADTEFPLFTWYDISGDYSGTWKAEGEQLAITFTSGTKITATLTKDGWTNFENISNHTWKINTAIASAAPSHESLIGTGWEATYDLNATVFEFLFEPNSKIHFPAVSTSFIYEQKKGAYKITFVDGSKTFGVFQTDNKIKGIDRFPNNLHYTWQAKKK